MLSLPLVFLAGAGSAHAATYNLIRSSVGTSFFDAFTYRGTYNFTVNQPTWNAPDNGDNWWANKTYAEKTGLTGFNGANAILRVDNKTPGDVLRGNFDDKRYSVRIDSNEYYGTGNLWVLDAVHVPFGCSVWPAFWLSGNDGTFPAGGEIDIVENVNRASHNQMNVHVDGVCTVPKDTPGLSSASVNCGDAGTANNGCSFGSDSLGDYGDAVNNNGGGVWVTEWSDAGVNFWFFKRANVPAALQLSTNASSIDTATLGTPFAAIPASSANCNFASLFHPVKIVLSIALCGNFAAAEPVFNRTCPLTPGLNAAQTCYQTFVAGPASGFDDAYWEVSGLRVFNDGSPSSYGFDPAQIRIAAPGQGGPQAGQSPQAPGGQTTTVATSATGSVKGTTTAGGSTPTGAAGRLAVGAWAAAVPAVAALFL